MSESTYDNLGFLLHVAGMVALLGAVIFYVLG